MARVLKGSHSFICTPRVHPLTHSPKSPVQFYLLNTGNIGVARGCTGCTCTPQGGAKFFSGPNLQGNVESAPPADAPPRQSKSPIFEEIEEIWTVEKVI